MLFLDVIACLFTGFASCCQYSSTCPPFLLNKTLEFVYVFHKGLSEKRSNSCTLLLQAGGLMLRLHANSYSCLDFFHNAETYYTTEETRRLYCLINNIMLIISNGWGKKQLFLCLKYMHQI